MLGRGLLGTNSASFTEMAVRPWGPQVSSGFLSSTVEFKGLTERSWRAVLSSQEPMTFLQPVGEGGNPVCSSDN